MRTYLSIIFIFLFVGVSWSYETKWINRLDQFGSTDIDLVISDKGKEVERVHKSFSGKCDLNAEADKEINRLDNPEPVVEVVPEPTVEELKIQVEELKQEIETVKAEKAELQASVSAEVIR